MNHLKATTVSCNLETAISEQKSLWYRFKKASRLNWQIYALLAPAVIYLFMFNYIPIYGVQVAFRDFVATKGIMGSDWVGLKYFIKFFESYYWKRMLINTLLLNLYGLIFSFPIPVFLAIMLNQIGNKKLKGFIQTTLYTPHFISVTVLVGMLYIFLSPSAGVVNKLIEALGGEAIFFLNDATWFRTIFTASGVWQNAGWGTMLYIAAISNIDPQLYEAATVDGATKWHKVWYIDLPCIKPVVITQLILNVGRMLASEFQKTYLMQTPGNMATSDTIGVYTYTVGVVGGQFSYTAAIGLLMTVVNFIMLIIVNYAAKKAGEEAVF